MGRPDLSLPTIPGWDSARGCRPMRGRDRFASSVESGGTARSDPGQRGFARGHYWNRSRIVCSTTSAPFKTGRKALHHTACVAAWQHTGDTWENS